MHDYKCLCAAVTISATIVEPKLDFYISITVSSKSRVNLSLGELVSDAR